MPPNHPHLHTATALALAQTANPAPPAGGDGLGDMLVLWGILLIAAALLLFFAEIFVPSGGLIALFGAASLVAGIIMLFKVDTNLGLFGALITLLALPFIVGLGLKIWPDLPWIRGLILQNNPTPDDPDNPAVPDPDPRPAPPAIGATGTALTDLRPIGTCRINGRRLECLATSGLIDAGTPIRVTFVDGMQIKVRPSPAPTDQQP